MNKCVFWLAKLLLYVGKWILIVPWPASWPEVPPKSKVAPTYRWPKLNSFQNSNNNANNTSLPAQSIVVTTVVSGPTSTQSKRVLKADGGPKGPNCWPWSIVQLKTSAPSSRSMLPGVPSQGWPSRCSTNASICDRKRPDGVADWWWLWVALLFPLPESFFDDLIRWDPPFHVKKVG